MDGMERISIEPPITIICRWRAFSFRARGEWAVFEIAASTSKPLDSSWCWVVAKSPVALTCWISTRRELLIMRLG
jgi:hypothetical protein